MSTQLGRSLIELCVLAVLKRGDSYGYQIIKDLGDYIEISESTLYPILRRLEQNESLEVYTVEHNSRLRKYYKITDAGRAKIEEFKIEWKEILKIYNFIVSEGE